MKILNDNIGNRTRVVPRIFLTNILRYLLYFAPGRKAFELNMLVILNLCVIVRVFVYRTQLSHSINSTSAVFYVSFYRTLRNVSKPNMFYGPNMTGNVILFPLQLLHPTLLVFNGSIHVGYTKEIKK